MICFNVFNFLVLGGDKFGQFCLHIAANLVSVEFSQQFQIGRAQTGFRHFGLVLCVLHRGITAKALVDFQHIFGQCNGIGKIDNKGGQSRAGLHPDCGIGNREL